jgi:hypothetical protein
MRIGVLYMGNERDRICGGVITHHLVEALRALGHDTWRASGTQTTDFSGVPEVDFLISEGIPASLMPPIPWCKSRRVVYWWLSNLYYDEAAIAHAPFDGIATNAATGRFPKVLRVGYPAGSASPTFTREYGGPVGGVSVLATCGLAPFDTRVLRYYVRFAEDLQFARGGKLPGLCGGTQFAGGRMADGTNGFSTPYMWRENGDGEIYLYSPASRRVGIWIGRCAWCFTPGRWHCLEQRVVLNRPGHVDGELSVSVDGTPVIAATEPLFRTVATLRIEALFFSSFFGGRDASWTTPISTTADFAAFGMSGDGRGANSSEAWPSIPEASTGTASPFPALRLSSSHEV